MENTDFEEKSRITKFFSSFGAEESKLEERAFFVIKIFLCVCLFVIEAVIFFDARKERVELLPELWILLSEILLLVSFALEVFKTQRVRTSVAFYLLSFLMLFVITVLTGSKYLSTLYLIILTEYYMRSEKLYVASLGFMVCMFLYFLFFWGAGALYGERVTIVDFFTRSLSDLILLGIHFLIVNIAIQFYKQFRKLRLTVRALNESKAELQKAYDVLAQTTALAERQRIAKDIHDTAGHSITTVIMQTEAAKLIIDKDVKTAKERIVSANLQAKHALEELRDSVHLLAGHADGETLKMAFMNIIGESTDGTNIVIRSDVDEVDVDDSVFRFLCNTLKEGISNGIRHGNATAFWVELKNTGEDVKFVLSDNGSGTDLKKTKRGFGLNSMSEQVKRLGGTVEFRSEKDDGFEIEIKLKNRR